VDTPAEEVLVFRRSRADATGFDIALELGRGDTLGSPLLPSFGLGLRRAVQGRLRSSRRAGRRPRFPSRGGDVVEHLSPSGDALALRRWSGALVINPVIYAEVFGRLGARLDHGQPRHHEHPA